MSDFTPFFVDRAKGGRASCKGCKQNCPGGELRLAKVVPSPYGEQQQMKSWHHVDCFMNALLKQRPATKRIESIDDIGNWQNLNKEDQEFLLKKINDMEKLYAEKNSGKYTAKLIKNFSNASDNSTASTSNTKSPSKPKVEQEVPSDDNMFSQFAKLCKKIAKVDAYTEKTAVVNRFFTSGTGDKYQGDLGLWCKLLLPQVSKRVYNLKSKQLVKLFSRIFNTDHEDMLTHLEQGDVADTIQHFFSKSKSVRPASDSTLTIHDVENFLEDLSKMTKEDEQIYQFKKIVKKCTLDDLKMLIRIIKGDLRINAGPKHILEGIHPDAYNVFQTARDLNMVLDRVLSKGSSSVKNKDSQRTVAAKLVLMTPVLPMLAEACKSVEMAMKKCPNGMFSEIKYDGERVQVHKKGNEFRYFSRALKPVMAHKVSHFKDFLPKAFPEGTDLVLDAEVLMVDVNTGKPLPFGTLGIHKQSEFKDAQVCLFVFDCLYYNGKVLLDVPIRKRRQILLDNMVEVKNHVMLSEQELIKKPADLAKMIAKVLQLGLEGLVLKDLESIYEPGKRHWLKVKKDYLFDGAMADTADLVVLGAWFGTGRKGGMMSVFLMGCLDTRRNKWCTVTKVHTGHDDSTLERLQKELSPLMVKISGEYSKVPSWLECNKGMVPDFMASDPKKQPVWEITGTELTKANLHTADGISVRFPRVTRIRDDKDWESATNLDELKHLYKTSKEKTDVTLLNKLAATASAEEQRSLPKKVKNQSPIEDKAKDSPKKLKTTTLDGFIKKEKKNDTSDNSSDREKKDKRDKETESSDSDKRDRKVKDEPKDSKKRKNRDSSPSDSGSDKKKDKSSKTRESHEHRSSSKKEIKKELNSSSETDSKNDESRKRKSRDETDKTKNKKRKIDTSDDAMYANDKTKKSKKRKNDDSREETQSKKSRKSSRDRKSPDTKIEMKEESNSSSDTIITGDEDHNEPSNKSLENTEIGKQLAILINQPLPDIFLDKRLGFHPDFISFDEELRDHFERHWIAYGGIVVKSIKSMDVDYVVHLEDTIRWKDMTKLRNKVPQGTRHVYKDWLITCINDEKLCDTGSYPVFVQSES